MKFEHTGATWERLQEANKPYLKRFFSNVDVLCVLRYKSRLNAVNTMRAAGYVVSVQKVKPYKDGKETTCSITVLQKWCLFFGEPLDRMLGEDYSLREDLK